MQRNANPKSKKEGDIAKQKCKVKATEKRSLSPAFTLFHFLCFCLLFWLDYYYFLLFIFNFLNQKIGNQICTEMHLFNVLCFFGVFCLHF